jgi:DNA-binding CsgD family transcriptional regulator
MTWLNSGELKERAFAFLSGASACRTIDELHAQFVLLAQAYGYKTVGFIRLLQVGGPVEPQVIFGEAPAEWLARYLEQDYGRVDPTIPLTFQSRQAFTWETAEARNRSKETKAFFGEARELFAQDSFIVPVWGPCGELSVVNLLSDHPLDLPDEERTMLQGLCSLYATLGLTLIEPGLPPAAEATRALGRRELQCLYWMGMGKHDQEIAVILGISPLTVRTYVDSARDKLGVTSRPALIRKAVTLGLLLPDRSTLRQ